MAIRLTKSGPRQPSAPTITFAHQRNVQTLARLLAEHRGHHSARDRFFGLIYSFLIYDHYAEAYKAHTGSRVGIGRSWLELANDPILQAIYARVLPWHDDGQLRCIELPLPIIAVSPFHNASAPRGITPGTYRLEGLSADQFVEIAWTVRCNLLHGSYDPCDTATFFVLRNVSRPMMAIVWDMMSQTQW